MWISAWIAKSKELKGSEGVIGEDGGPAEEEDRHDQDQHVDHLQGKEMGKKRLKHLVRTKMPIFKKNMFWVEDDEMMSHLPRFSLLVKSARCCCNYLKEEKTRFSFNVITWAGAKRLFYRYGLLTITFMHCPYSVHMCTCKWLSVCLNLKSCLSNKHTWGCIQYIQ